MQEHKRILGIPPLTPEWFRYRYGRITATDVSAILGKSPYRTPLEVWARLTGKTPCPDFSQPEDLSEVPFALKRGRYLEPACMAMYADETGRLVSAGPGLIQDAELDWLCSTPDGGIERTAFIEHPEPGARTTPHGVIEAKAPGHHMAKEWEVEVPLAFRIQLQINMRCWDRGWGAVAALLPEAFLYQDQERNPVFLERVLDFVNNWRIKYVLADIQPPPMALDNALVNSLLPEAVDEMVILPASVAVLAHQDKDLQRLEGAVKLRRKAIRTGLKAIMGQSAYADAGEGHYLKRSTTIATIKAKPEHEQTRTTLYHVKKEPAALRIVGPHEGVDIAAITESLGVASILDSAPDVESLELPDPSAGPPMVGRIDPDEHMARAAHDRKREEARRRDMTNIGGPGEVDHHQYEGGAL